MPPGCLIRILLLIPFIWAGIPKAQSSNDNSAAARLPFDECARTLSGVESQALQKLVWGPVARIVLETQSELRERADVNLDDTGRINERGIDQFRRALDLDPYFKRQVFIRLRYIHSLAAGYLRDFQGRVHQVPQEAMDVYIRSLANQVFRMANRNEFLLPFTLKPFQIFPTDQGTLLGFLTSFSIGPSETGMNRYRGLGQYKTESPSFAGLLESLGAGDVWIDLGSGSYRAPRELYADDSLFLPDFVGIDPYLPPADSTLAGSDSNESFTEFRNRMGDRFSIIQRPLAQIPHRSLPRGKLVSDFHGPATYTDSLEDTLGRELALPIPGGSLVIVGPDVTLVDSEGELMTSSRFGGFFGGVEFRNIGLGWIFTRTDGPVTLPRMELLDYVPGTPPQVTYMVSEK